MVFSMMAVIVISIKYYCHRYYYVEVTVAATHGLAAPGALCHHERVPEFAGLHVLHTQ